LLAVPSGQGPYRFYVPPSWPQRPRQALLREPARRHVSLGQRALAAAGYWRLQAGPYYDEGLSCALPAPVAGTSLTLRHFGLTDLPHQTRRGQRQHLGRFLRVPLSVFSKSFHIRGTLRGAGGAEEVLTPLWARACRPLRLKHFLHKFAWKRERLRDQPARRGLRNNLRQGFRQGVRSEGPWPSASA